MSSSYSDLLRILDSLESFGAVTGESMMETIIKGEPLYKWLKESFPFDRKYKSSKNEDGSEARYYSPVFSGLPTWNQEAFRGEFELKRVTSFTRYDPYSHSNAPLKTEERTCWMIPDRATPTNLWLTYSEDSVEFHVGMSVSIRLEIPSNPSESPEWSALTGKSSMRRGFGWVENVDVPYDLIEAWTSGDLVSVSHLIVRKSDYWITYNDGLRYRYGFYRWSSALGNDPLGRLQKAGCMDEDTLKLMKAQIEEPRSMINAVLIREKDRDRLRILAKVEREERFLSYRQLTRLLGYSSKGGGCYSFIRRMKDKGLIEVVEGTEGSGVRIRLTSAGRAVL